MQQWQGRKRLIQELLSVIETPIDSSEVWVRPQMETKPICACHVGQWMTWDVVAINPL